MENITNKYIKTMNCKQEQINYINAIVALNNGNVKFTTGKKQTIILFVPYNESIHLNFENAEFLKVIDNNLFEIYQKEKTIPIPTIKSFSYESLALIITKSIEAYNCEYCYEYYCELLADCT